MIKELLTPLEALDNIICDLEYITRLDYTDPIVRGEVRDELYKIYHRELPELEIIEKALKILEIIKEKVIPLVNIEEDFDEPNIYYRVYDNEHYGYKELTKEEFDLLNGEIIL